MKSDIMKPLLFWRKTIIDTEFYKTEKAEATHGISYADCGEKVGQLDATDKLLSNMIEELKSGRYNDYIEWLVKVYGFKGCLKDMFHPKILRLYYEWLSQTL